MMKYAQDYEKSDSLYDETLQSDQIHFSPASSYPSSPIISQKKRNQNDSDDKRARRLERNREAARRYN